MKKKSIWDTKKSVGIYFAHKMQNEEMKILILYKNFAINISNELITVNLLLYSDNNNYDEQDFTVNNEGNDNNEDCNNSEEESILNAVFFQ